METTCHGRSEIPIGTRFHSVLNEYQDAITQLFSSSSYGVEFKGESLNKANHDRILACQQQLDFTLNQLEAHQRFQRLIQETSEGIRILESIIQESISTLSSTSFTLSGAVATGRTKLSSVHTSRDHAYPFSSIITYAKRIAPFTSAPANFDPSTPDPRVMPPYPTEPVMQAGLLYMNQDVKHDFCMVEEEMKEGKDGEGVEGHVEVGQGVVDAFGQSVQHDAQKPDVLDLDFGSDSD